MVLPVVRYCNWLIWDRVMGSMNGRMLRAENPLKEGPGEGRSHQTARCKGQSYRVDQELWKEQ